jgi:hypothetical protein
MLSGIAIRTRTGDAFPLPLPKSKRECREGDYMRSPEEIEKYWSKVSRTTSCWFWTGAKDKDGYGQYKIRYSGPDGNPIPITIRQV